MDIVDFLSLYRQKFLEMSFIRAGKGNSYARKRMDLCDKWIKDNNLFESDDFRHCFNSVEEFWFYLLRPSINPKNQFCPICGKPLEFETIKKKRRSCSKECMLKLSHSEEWSKRIKDNWKNKSPEEKAEIKRRMENTMLERYGVKSNWSNGPLRDALNKKWDEKYGTHHLLSCKSVRDKIKETKKKKYGDENYTNRKKARDTMVKLYGGYYNNSEKIKESWHNKSPEELKAIREKKEATCLERYGCKSYLSTEDKMEKTKQTCLKKYGVEHFSKSEKVKEKKRQTNLERFGVDVVLKSEVIKERIKQTCLEKYGVDSISKSPEFQSKANHLYIYDDCKFDSKYELYFYIYHKEILKDDIKRGLRFEYEFDGKNNYYFCDFLVNGENVEIKGEQLLDENDNLYYPYRNMENWQWFQKKWDAKNECMKRNHVRLLKFPSDELNKVMQKVDEKYTKDYVPLFNIHNKFPYPNDKMKDFSDLGLIHHFHKSIYSAKRNGLKSPLDAWDDKNLVKEIALNRLKYVGSCKPSDILQGFNVTLKAPKVSTFLPSLAENLISIYLKDCDTICDPFSGFSGRMLGSEKCGKTYFGFDINELHVAESNEIIKFKNFVNSKIMVRDILSDFEIENYDALFTCPPYNLKEIWNENETDKSCDDWIDVCLQKFNCKKYLFVVDDVEKYKSNIIKVLEKDSHFGKRIEKVVLISKEEI